MSHCKGNRGNYNCGHDGDNGDGGGGDGGDDGGWTDVDFDLGWNLDDLAETFNKKVLQNPEKWVSDGFDSFVSNIISGTGEAFTPYVKALTTPLIGTPAPKGSGQGINLAWKSASNSPWKELISGFYFEGILGIALGIQCLTLAAVGLRYKSMNPGVRKRVGRRLAFAFMSIFLWLPAASIAGQFFNAVGTQIVYTGGLDEEKIGSTIVSATAWTVTSGTGVSIIVLVVGAYVIFKVIFISISRWIMLIALTLAMPLVASFWALEVWPFNRFAGISKQVAGAYPGLLAAGIPAAFLLRLSVTLTDAGSGVWDEALSPFVALIALYLAGKSQKIVIRRSANAAWTASQQTLDGAKKSVKKPAKVGAAAAAAGATLGATAATGGAAAPAAASTGAKAASKGARTAQRGVSKTAAKARTVRGAIGTATNVAKGNVGRSASQAYQLRVGREQQKQFDDGKENEEAESSGDEFENGRSTEPLEPHSMGPFRDDGDDDEPPAPPVTGGGGGGDPPDSTPQSNGHGSRPGTYSEALETKSDTSSSSKTNGRSVDSPPQSGSTSNGSSAPRATPSTSGAGSESTTDSGRDERTPNQILANSDDYSINEDGNVTRSAEPTSPSWGSQTTSDDSQQDSTGKPSSDGADSGQSTESSFDDDFFATDRPLEVDAIRDPDDGIDYQYNGGSNK